MQMTAAARSPVGPDLRAVPDVVLWPRSSTLGPLGALPTVPRLARAFTEMVLGGWGLDELTDSGKLIISELATNAFRAAEGADGQPRYHDGYGLPVVWLRLMSNRQRLRIEVWDNVPAVPAARHADPDEESGRGLEIVASLSENWGWDHMPAIGAKAVWATLLTVH